MISVIITAYNREKTIERCVMSALSQNCSDCEIIVIDDGSEDNTPAILKKCALAYPDRLKVICGPHAGVAAARNAGLAAASGDYITYLDSDDYYLAGALADMKEAIGDADVLIYDAVCEYEDGRREAFPSFRDGLSGVCPGPISKELAILSKPCPWNHLIKKEIYDSLDGGFPQGRWYEDFGALPVLMSKAGSFIYTQKPLVCYYQSTASVMRSNGYNNHYEDIFPITEHVVHELKSDFPSEAEFLACEHLLISGGKRFLACERKDMAGRCSDYMHETFPDFQKNKYVLQEPFKKRVLAGLIYKKKFGLLKLLGK